MVIRQASFTLAILRKMHQIKLRQQVSIRKVFQIKQTNNKSSGDENGYRYDGYNPARRWGLVR